MRDVIPRLHDHWMALRAVSGSLEGADIEHIAAQRPALLLLLSPFQAKVRETVGEARLFGRGYLNLLINGQGWDVDATFALMNLLAHNGGVWDEFEEDCLAVVPQLRELTGRQSQYFDRVILGLLYVLKTHHAPLFEAVSVEARQLLGDEYFQIASRHLDAHLDPFSICELTYSEMNS